MPKKRDKSSDEWYKGKIRELEKETKQLRRRLKHSEKFNKSQDDEVSTDSEDTHPTLIEKTTKTCEVCGKGIISQKEIIGRFFEECDTCDYRKKIDVKE
jgi:hypothetical protein